MKKFIFKVLLFGIPVVLLIMIPVAVLVGSKENFRELKPVLERGRKYLIGYTYNEDNYKYLKWEYLNLHEKNEVMVLGSSRVLQFREQMFDVSFYNSGYSISGLNDLKPFLQSLPTSKYPKYLILGLDQWMFNESWDNLKTQTAIETWEKSFSKYPAHAVYKNVYIDLFMGKYDFHLFDDTDTLNLIGLNARVNHTGFRNDGSFYYGSQIEKLLASDSTASDFKYASTLVRIKEGNKRFQFGRVVNCNAIKVLADFLKYSELNNIKVIAFLSPFPDTIYNMMEASGNYTYMPKIYSTLEPLCKRYNCELYDFSTVSKCGSTDQETIDGFHGGELVYQRILLEMLRANSCLNSVTDSSRLNKDLAMAKSRFLLYSY